MKVRTQKCLQNDPYWAELTGRVSLSRRLSSVCQHCSSLSSLRLNTLTICSLWLRQILKRTENQGNIGGARLLLKRLVKNEAGWFSQFLQALEDTEHHELVRELRGEPCNEDGEARNHLLHQAEVIHHSHTPLLVSVETWEQTSLRLIHQDVFQMFLRNWGTNHFISVP